MKACVPRVCVGGKFKNRWWAELTAGSTEEPAECWKHSVCNWGGDYMGEELGTHLSLKFSVLYPGKLSLNSEAKGEPESFAESRIIWFGSLPKSEIPSSGPGLFGYSGGTTGQNFLEIQAGQRWALLVHRSPPQIMLPPHRFCSLTAQQLLFANVWLVWMVFFFFF